MDNYLKVLKDLVLEQKQEIRLLDVVNFFEINVEQAKTLIECFEQKYSDEFKFEVKYTIYGYKKEEGDLIGSNKFQIVDKNEIEEEKKFFLNNNYEKISCYIRSIKLNEETDNVTETNHFKSRKLIIKDEDLLKYQRNGFMYNNEIHLREDKRNRFIRFLKSRNEFEDDNKVSKIESNLKDVKSENINKSITSLKKEPKNEKNDVFDKFKVYKEEPEEKMDIDINNKKDIEIKEKTISNKINFEISDNIEDKEFNEKIQYKTSKRTKTFESDSDEDSNLKENKNKLKKHKKRKVIFDDSSDEENVDIKNKTDQKQDETESSSSKTKESDFSYLVKEEETYVDEDGYTVTKQVKKLVKEKSIENKNLEMGKNSNLSIKNVGKKTKKNAPIAKNQALISNFFSKK